MKEDQIKNMKNILTDIIKLTKESLDKENINEYIKIDFNEILNKLELSIEKGDIESIFDDNIDENEMISLDDYYNYLFCELHRELNHLEEQNLIKFGDNENIIMKMLDFDDILYDRIKSKFGEDYFEKYFDEGKNDLEYNHTYIK